MLVRYFRRPSRIEQLRSNTGVPCSKGSPRNCLRAVLSGLQRPAYSSGGALSSLDHRSKAIDHEH